MTKGLDQRTERDLMGSGTTGVACARLGRRFVGALKRRGPIEAGPNILLQLPLRLLSTAETPWPH